MCHYSDFLDRSPCFHFRCNCKVCLCGGRVRRQEDSQVNNRQSENKRLVAMLRQFFMAMASCLLLLLLFSSFFFSSFYYALLLPFHFFSYFQKHTFSLLPSITTMSLLIHRSEHFIYNEARDLTKTENGTAMFWRAILNREFPADRQLCTIQEWPPSSKRGNCRVYCFDDRTERTLLYVELQTGG